MDAGRSLREDNLRKFELLALLLHELDQVLVYLGEVLLAVLLGNRLRLGVLASGALLGDHDDGRGPLRAAGGAELGARADKDVRDVDVLAQHGDVADDVHRGDITSKDDDAGEGGVGWPSGRGLAQRLDNLFYAALEGL